jgi:hypothetical protein
MALYGGQDVGFLLVSGRSMLPSKPQGLMESVEAMQEDTSGLGDVWGEVTPTGMKRAELSQDGAFYNEGTNSSHETLRDAQTTSRVVCLGVEGNTIGKRFVGYAGAYAHKYDVLAKVGGLTKANVEYTINGARDEGIILQSLAAQTADWNTEGASNTDYTLDPAQRVIPITSNSIANPTVVTTPIPHGLTTGDIILVSGVASSSPTINGSRTVTVITATTFSVPVNVTVAGTGGSFVRANSTGGGIAFQQVTAYSGFTGYVGKVRDSADDITYADLATFANVTSAPSAEAVTVAGTVDRYLAADGNVTGSGSITVFIGFSRR